MPVIPNDGIPQEQPLCDREEEEESIIPDHRDQRYEISAELPGQDPTKGRRRPPPS